MTNANGKGERKVTSLRELPQEVQPTRDLWAGIEASINAERRSDDATHDADKGADGVKRDASGLGSRQGGGRTRRRTPALPRWIAAAAMIAAVAVGIWIGRSSLPFHGPATPPVSANNGTHVASANDGAKALQAAYMSDPKYREERAALVKSLEAKLASLPPDSRAKVLSSLETIHQSMQDLEAALGKDPTNALLQELLLNTYQDEMRVLTTVHEARETGKGI